MIFKMLVIISNTHAVDGHGPNTVSSLLNSDEVVNIITVDMAA
jgi:hypothetical protein